jgi:small-conductance mechanosensitive channel
MKVSRKWLLIGSLGLVGLAIAGLVLTRTPRADEAQVQGQDIPVAEREQAVEQRPLETAQKLAALAVTRQEQQLARHAVRLADREADLAYASALRAANQQAGQQSAEVRAIEARIQGAQVKIKADQGRVKQLTERAAGAKVRDQENLQRELELAQAELALDQDELADAQEDLVRAGGDERTRLKHLWEEHEATQHSNGAVQVNSNSPNLPETLFSAVSLIGKLRSWSALHEKRAQVLQGRDAAFVEAESLSGRHEALEKQASEEKAKKERFSSQTAGILKSGNPARDEGGDQKSKDTAAALSSLHRLSEDEKNLADLDKRIQALRELGSTYGQWSALLAAAQRTSLHEIIKSALWIVVTVLILFAAGETIDRFLAHLTLESKQQLRLRQAVRFAIQVIAVFVIVFVILGSPNQMPTILGLAGAGLTVSLKDFIVAFFGWFVLMGRNGIRLGDLVEINGVRGKVIDIGMLRTVLLETGNWTEAEHPTGRQVAFLNGFAVEGHYFNYSTSGQWLWDELRVFVPSGENPYPLIEEIRAIVTKETESTAQLAEQEWQSVTRRYGVASVSGAPAVDMRITDPGLEVVIRYITRANERSEVRSRLNHAIIKLLRRGEATMTAETPTTVPK